ncbi:rabphilin-3A-like protein [Leptotrombidium deliense]|uniref:Rabphilin-3A-like protein n=1 Tax=Leptotrombidium deliense TaxID=299467 RepID=A0A443RWJ3_9ACAR|nr:rabphilin-3A-like protein [Leptotrombidium deliense]
MLLQICYDMKAAILYITIIKARNLMKLSIDQLPDPFVKCYLLPPRM